MNVNEVLKKYRAIQLLNYDAFKIRVNVPAHGRTDPMLVTVIDFVVLGSEIDCLKSAKRLDEFLGRLTRVMIDAARLVEFNAEDELRRAAEEP